MPYRDILPQDIIDRYEIHEWRHAAAILANDFRVEYDDLMTVLRNFGLFRSEVQRPGGGRSLISSRIDYPFRQRDWREQSFQTRILVNDLQVDARGHKVDNFKNRVAVDVEWNNKTEFYDRDLNNFAHLHALGALSVGVIITRASHLQSIFDALGRDSASGKPYGAKYGPSTTHMDKLLPKVNGGGAGGCPVLCFGITRECYLDDLTDPTLYVEHPDPASRAAAPNRQKRRKTPSPAN